MATPQDPIEQWVRENHPVIQEAYNIFLRTREWPKTRDLTRHFATKYQDVDVQAIASSKPRVPGEMRAVHQEMLSLAIRHLRYLPPAHQLIQICLAATRHAARKYRIPDAELKVSSDEPEIALVAGGNNDLLQLAGQLLDAELASPLAGGGPVGAGWSYFINDGLIRNYENVESADRFVEVQDALLSQYAQRMQPHMAVYPEVNGDLSDDGSLAQELGEEIFVVHGRGDERTEVAAEIGRLTGRPPIILEEQPDGGSPTIIEKLEREARRAGYAVVIFSGDDEGRLRGSDSSGASEPPLQPRARQNVVAELGYFMGKLGRQRVKVIYEPGVELPSDFGGLAYVASEPHTAEKAAR